MDHAPDANTAEQFCEGAAALIKEVNDGKLNVDRRLLHVWSCLVSFSRSRLTDLLSCWPGYPVQVLGRHHKEAFGRV